MIVPLMKFEGGKEMQAALEKLPTRVSRRFQFEALTHAAEPMRRAMEVKAPHEPGKPDIRDQMVINRTRGIDAKEAAVAVGPSKKGWYGGFVEFGTAHTSPQPFVRPAFAENAATAMQRLAADIWASLASRGIHRSSQSFVIGVQGEER